ncbi:MAG: protein-glutamate O-methyltransferase CheR [Flavobacteriales bacterium]|nr:protein-glutamate O-methyltransferase CheR [Flavobacteriales bacterium]
MRQHANEISGEELKALTGAIRTRYGIDFTNYEVKSLKRGIARLITKHETGSLLGLWSKILRDRDFFMKCIDDLTVNLTDLFRNPDFWVFLHDEVLDSYKTQRKIDVWHAGCSTGEEIYSMAVVLEDKDLLHKSQLWATDLSSRALAKAIDGKYSKTLIGRYEKGLLNYLPNKSINEVFNIYPSHIEVKGKYKKKIDYQQHNLVHDSVKKKFDIIFCRNVMIYFDNNLKMKVLRLFHESLNEDGVFIVGYYDVFPNESKTLFEPLNSKTRVYKKVINDTLN